LTKGLEEDEEETSHQHTSLDPADELSKMAENKIFHIKCSESSQSWKETRRRGAPLPPSNSKRQKKQRNPGQMDEELKQMPKTRGRTQKTISLSENRNQKLETGTEKGKEIL
jgi:hypothetical protein